VDVGVECVGSRFEGWGFGFRVRGYLLMRDLGWWSRAVTKVVCVQRAKVLVAAMVFEGRESLSHVLGILGRYTHTDRQTDRQTHTHTHKCDKKHNDRYLPVLRVCVHSEEDQHAAADAVEEVWAKSNSMCVVVLDKLVALKLIAPITLVRWLLGDYEQCKARSDVVWELLIFAINKPVALVKTVRNDLATAQKELEQLKV
jgi:hypothetical protein